MDYNCIVKIVEKVSKNGNKYSVAEIYIDNKLIKSGIFLNEAEKTLFSLLG